MKLIGFIKKLIRFVLLTYAISRFDTMISAAVSDLSLGELCEGTIPLLTSNEGPIPKMINSVVNVPGFLESHLGPGCPTQQDKLIHAEKQPISFNQLKSETHRFTYFAGHYTYHHTNKLFEDYVKPYAPTQVTDTLLRGGQKVSVYAKYFHQELEKSLEEEPPIPPPFLPVYNDTRTFFTNMFEYYREEQAKPYIKDLFVRFQSSNWEDVKTAVKRFWQVDTVTFLSNIFQQSKAVLQQKLAPFVSKIIQDLYHCYQSTTLEGFKAAVMAVWEDTIVPTFSHVKELFGEFLQDDFVPAVQAFKDWCQNITVEGTVAGAASFWNDKIVSCAVWTAQQVQDTIIPCASKGVHLVKDLVVSFVNIMCESLSRSDVQEASKDCLQCEGGYSACLSSANPIRQSDRCIGMEGQQLYRCNLEEAVKYTGCIPLTTGKKEHSDKEQKEHQQEEERQQEKEREAERRQLALDSCKLQWSEKALSRQRFQDQNLAVKAGLTKAQWHAKQVKDSLAEKNSEYLGELALWKNVEDWTGMEHPDPWVEAREFGYLLFTKTTQYFGCHVTTFHWEEIGVDSEWHRSVSLPDLNTIMQHFLPQVPQFQQYRDHSFPTNMTIFDQFEDPFMNRLMHPGARKQLNDMWEIVEKSLHPTNVREACRSLSCKIEDVEAMHGIYNLFEGRYENAIAIMDEFERLGS